MANQPDIHWPGKSGKKYGYWIHPIDTSFKAEPGNYVFAKKTSSGTWTPIYIGETDNLYERLSNHKKLPCVKRYGGTHIHAHVSSSDEKIRRAEESDLIEKWNPPCNG